MGQVAIRTHSDRNPWGVWYALLVSVVLVAAGLAFVSWDGLTFMVHKWSSEVYGHGYFIPVITVLLIAQKRRELSALELRGAWAGTVVALAGLMLWFYLPATWDALRPPLGLVLAAFVVLFPLRILHATLRGL